MALYNPQECQLQSGIVERAAALWSEDTDLSFNCSLNAGSGTSHNYTVCSFLIHKIGTVSLNLLGDNEGKREMFVT